MPVVVHPVHFKTVVAFLVEGNSPQIPPLAMQTRNVLLLGLLGLVVRQAREQC